MENSKEIAENKLRIERFEKLIASSKSMVFELEHEIAELEEKRKLKNSIRNSKLSIKNNLKM